MDVYHNAMCSNRTLEERRQATAAPVSLLRERREAGRESFGEAAARLFGNRTRQAKEREEQEKLDYELARQLQEEAYRETAFELRDSTAPPSLVPSASEPEQTEEDPNADADEAISNPSFVSHGLPLFFSSEQKEGNQLGGYEDILTGRFFAQGQPGFNPSGSEAGSAVTAWNTDDEGAEIGYEPSADVKIPGIEEEADADDEIADTGDDTGVHIEVAEPAHDTKNPETEHEAVDEDNQLDDTGNTDSEIPETEDEASAHDENLEAEDEARADKEHADTQSATTRSVPGFNLADLQNLASAALAAQPDTASDSGDSVVPKTATSAAQPDTNDDDGDSVIPDDASSDSVIPKRSSNATERTAYEEARVEVQEDTDEGTPALQERFDSSWHDQLLREADMTSDQTSESEIRTAHREVQEQEEENVADDDGDEGGNTQADHEEEEL
jgi:hypothetical protein